MKKFTLFLSALLISIMSYAGTVTFDVAVDKTEVSTAAELTLTKDGVSLHVSQGILGNGTNYRVYKNQWIDVSCEYGNITSIEFTCTREGTAQYGPGCFEYRGSAGTYTYDGFIGTWTGNEEKVTLYATLNQVRATKIVVTYESSDANFVSQPMITGDLNFADTANVVITADEGMKIYYTLDGTDPTTASTEYIAPFEVYATTTVKAIAYNEAIAASSMITETVFTQATKVPCAEAAAIAKALSNNTETTDLYYNVKGYVTSLKDTFNTSTSKQQFWIADTKTGGEVLYAYNNQVPCAMEVGMKVRIVGKLKQWNTGQYIQPQIVNAEITVLAPATETVYFINTKKWSAVTAHAWGAKLPDTAWPGLATVKETEQIAGFDVYSFTANVGDYANVIFNNKGGGSQTPDLVWTAGKYYVIDLGWLTKEEAEAKLATPLPEVWNIVGDAGLMGKGWDLNAAENAMTKQEDGTYLLEKKSITITAGTYEYKAAKDHGWTVAVPQDGNQKLTISKSGIYDVTFVLNVTTKKLTATATLKQEAVVIPTVIIAGDMNGWDQNKDKFTMSADSLTATFKTTLAVKNYGFKMIVGGAWLSDGKTITRDANTYKFTGANGGNSTLKADIAGEYLFTWEYATKTLTVTYPKLPAKPEVVTEMVGVVKRAIQNGNNTIVLTHEADGTAHIYEVANGTILELVQEGIIPVDTTNLGDYLAISDIALTEDGKLVATNKIVCQASDNEVDAGYKRGELRAYIWNDLHDVPSILFTSKMSSNWYRSIQGNTIAYKGTSTNGTLFTTGVTATGVKFRYSVYNVIDGVYTDPAVNDSEHFHFTKGSAQTTDVLGANYQLVASPLAATNWILDGELVEPFEIVDPLTYNTEVTANPALAIDLGKKYNGTSIVTVGEQHLMVAPYANAEGLLAGVKVLDITTGLAAAVEITTADLDAAIAATAAATAVKVVDDENIAITLIADAAVYNLTATLAEPIEYVDITMTNMVATDMGTYTLVEASDDMTAIGVALAIDAEGKLVEGSTVDWYGTEMPIVSSEVFTKTYSEELASDVYTGKLVIDFMGGLMGLNLTMYTIPVETIEVTIENAEVVVDLDWSELSYAANWTYEEVTYPVSVLLYGYDEEETEFEGMQIAELQIGGDGDDDPWLDYAVAEAVTVTKAGNVITLKGEFSSYATGNIYELTISGEEVKSSVDNIQLHVESVKLIRNHQLIIRKDGREFNAQGATIQ